MSSKPPYQEFGDRLNEAITHNNVSYHRLAKLLNVSPKLVKAWLHGRQRPEPSYLDLLAHHLVLSLSELMELAGYTENKWLAYQRNKLTSKQVNEVLDMYFTK